MKDKIILRDGTSIKLEASGNLTSMVTLCKDWLAVAELMPKLTEDNLTSVQVQTGEGVTVGRYNNLVVQPGTWEAKEEGIFIGLSFRVKTEIEKRLDNLEAGQEVQDGAITELADVMSEGGEG